MTFTMPSVRTLWIRPPARRTAAYHVVVSSADAPIALRADAERDRRTLDAVTALFVGPIMLDALAAELPETDPSLVLEIPSILASGRMSMTTEAAFARPMRRTVVMSAGTLLLAQQLRQRAQSEWASRDGTSYLEIPAGTESAIAFLDELQTDLVNAPASGAARQSSLRRRALVDRARRQLAEAPGSAHPLPDLAESLGVSAFHFARVFRAETGLSVHQYLLRLRMAVAVRRLSSRGTDLSRLALELGFSSHSHFTATFHKEFGVNPAHVRNVLTRDRRGTSPRFLPWPACVAQ